MILLHDIAVTTSQQCFSEPSDDVGEPSDDEPSNDVDEPSDVEPSDDPPGELLFGPSENKSIYEPFSYQTVS